MIPSTSSTRRRLLAIAGSFALLGSPALAHVGLLAPNGAEVLCAGSMTSIEWEIHIQHNTLNWDLEYSTTGAAGPWIPIAIDLPPGDTSPGAMHSYDWTVPDESSTQVRVRVTMDNTGGGDYSDISDADLTIHGASSATFRTDFGGANPPGFVAAAPVIGAPWTATVDNALTGNSVAGVVGYGTPAYVSLAFGVLLVNVADPDGELLGLAPKAGTDLVSFDLDVPNDYSLCGFTLSTQGYGIGGGSGPSLHNAYDLVVGTF